ncbi:hypothetical protein Tco_1225009, partial [Tanacetum coccineum]
EDPNRDGERGFNYLTSALVSSKAHREGCRASRGRFPYCALISTINLHKKSKTMSQATTIRIKYLIYLLLGLSVKNTLAIQRCKLSYKELDEFLSFYPLPSEYRVILPTSTQTILDAPPGLNPFGCSKLTTFIVMCKAYDYEPSVELFRGFFIWLTFQKRSEKHIPSLLAKVITRIEGWHQRFFFIQDTIVPSKFPQILLKENMLDVKSFKDKLPSGIKQNPQFQRLGRYPVSARAFEDPILFLAGLQSSWEHGQQRPAIVVGGKDEDLTFLPKDLSPCFNTSSPYVSTNTKPVKTDEEPAVEPVNERVGTIADSRGSPVGIKSLLEVTAVKLVLLVQKLLLLVLKVNTAERLQLLKG